MCCGRGWKAGSRTRPPAASCAAACRPGWSGARPAVRSACTPTRPSPASSPRCSSSSRSAGRCGPPGCGCASRAYAGAYVYGRTRDERYLGKDGVLRKRRRKLPRDQWEVLITGHHQGFTDWDTYLANQERIGANIRPQARQPGTGAVREGCALLQGLATCGACGRKLAVFNRGPGKSVPAYYCQGPGALVDGRGTRHLNVGGLAIDAAVAETFLAALAPAALQACLAAAQQLEDGHDAALGQWRRQVEQARYAATKAERRYRAVDPENRLVARGLEADWEQALRDLTEAQAELTRRETARPTALTDDQRATILALGDDLSAVWRAPTTTDKDRKQLLRTLLEEVNITVHRGDPEPHADLVLRWKGSAIGELTVPLRRPQPKIRTGEDTIALLRRLAVHYPDAKIAGILNRQGRRTARGLSYTASRVQSLRYHRRAGRRCAHPDPRRRTPRRRTGPPRPPPARHRRRTAPPGRSTRPR